MIPVTRAHTALAMIPRMNPSQTVPGQLVPHGYGVILGSSPGSSVTMVGNLFGHIVERNPLSRAAELVFVNNVVYDRAHMDLDLQSNGVTPTKTTALRNVFVRGPSYARDTSPVYIRTGGSLGLGAGSRAYVNGNLSIDYVREMITLTAGDTITGLLSLEAYPVWNGGIKIINTGNNLALESVLTNSGARPADRDSADKRVVSNVRNRTGKIINCVSSNGTTRCNKNAGGWPSLAANRRALTLPSNPNTVTSSGYTNIELWLHAMDGSISGVTQASSPASPQKLTVN